MVYPLRLYNTSDLRISSDSDQEYITYLTALELAASALTDPGVITTSSSGNVFIGSLTNTFYEQAVGTHSGTSLSIGATTSNFYQVANTTANENDSDFHFPVFWDSDLSGIKQMTDSDLTATTTNILTTIMRDEYPGTYRLAPTNSPPGANYSVLLSNMFTDLSLLDSNPTYYSIFKKVSQDAPINTHRSIKLKRAGDVNSGSFQGLQLMTDSEIRRTFGTRAKNIINSSGIGTYRIRSSGEGAPTEPGTWVVRGQALDTRNDTTEILYPENAAYGTTPTTPFATVEVYAGGLANYTRDFTSTIPGSPLTFVSDASTFTSTGSFVSDIADYTRVITTFFSASNSFVGPAEIIAQYYTGPSYAGLEERFYLGATELPFQGVSIYTGPAEVEFSGLAPKDYQGTFYQSDVSVETKSYLLDGGSYGVVPVPLVYSQTQTYVNYAGNSYVSNPTGYVGGISSPIPVSYGSQYEGDDYYSLDANYTGISSFVADYALATYTTDYTLAGNYDATTQGNVGYVLQYTGPNVVNFSQESFVGPGSVNYTMAVIPTYEGTTPAGYITAYENIFFYEGTGPDKSTYSSDAISNFQTDNNLGDYAGLLMIYLGPSYYLGPAAPGTNYTGPGPENFLSAPGGASGFYSPTYTGVTPANYTRPAVNNTYQAIGPDGTTYVGFPPIQYQGQGTSTQMFIAAQYTRLVTFPANYTGLEIYSTGYDVGRGTDGYFTTSYSDYIATYATLYTEGLALFEGTTIDISVSTIETYTLYCRVS